MLFKVTIVSLLATLASCQDIGCFWHLTDLHYDPWYGEPSGISCNEHVQNPGEYGDYECDAPWALVKSSIQGMIGIDSSNAEFILWSGDNPPHVYNKSLEYLVNNDMIIDITQNITTIIKEAFPHTVVLPMVGNNDYYPKNQLPGERNALYDAFFDMWSDWLDTEDMEDTFRRGAYYTRVISETPKVHAVVLNTNLYYHSNDATAGQDDPGGQIAWFENLMNTVRQNGEKAHIFTHVPPGILGVNSRMYKDIFNTKFVELFVKHSDIILGSYGVHTHTNVFRLFVNNEGEAVSSMFIAPSVTPWRVPLATGKTPPHNPGLRMVKFDKDTYELTDYEQYSLDLSDANNGRVDWKWLYRFTSQYGVTDIRTPSLVALLDEFKELGSEKFNKYYDAVYLNTIVDGEYYPCDCDCKSSHLCAIEFVDYDEFDACYATRPACAGACGLRALGVTACLSVLLLKLFL